MKKRLVLSIMLFIIGLFLIEPKTTGAVIGASSSSIIGILLVLISGILFIFDREERKKKRNKLEKILSGATKPITIPFYKTVKEGIENTEEMSPFRAKTRQGISYFVHVKSKKEAADLANYLVQGRRLYGAFPEIPGKTREETKRPRKRARSLDLGKIKKAIKEGKFKKFRVERMGFVRKEYETKEGRGWEKEALYDKPHPPHIPLPHYDVTYGKARRKKEIHILVKED